MKQKKGVEAFNYIFEINKILKFEFESKLKYCLHKYLFMYLE